MEGFIRRSRDIFKCFVISYLSRGRFSFFQQCDKLQDNYNVVLSLQEQLARMQQVGPSFGVYRVILHVVVTVSVLKVTHVFFGFSMRYDRLAKLAPLTHPMGNETKMNRHLLVKSSHVFSRALRRLRAFASSSDWFIAL